MEAVEFNQLLPEFEGFGLTVLGTSVDPLEKLVRFRDKHELAFELVTDSDRKIGFAYQTLKSPGGTHERDTVVIAGDGTILAAFERAHARGHAAEVLAAVRRLREEGRV